MQARAVPPCRQSEVAPSLIERQSALVREVMALRAAGDLRGARRLTGELLLTLRPALWRVVQRVMTRAGSLSRDDLEQVAAIAAIKAVEKYDPARRGSQSFGHFIYFRALNACTEYIRLHSADVHVSDGARKGRTVRQARSGDATVPSLTLVSFDAAATGQESPDGTHPESLLADAELHARLRALVHTLPPRSRELVSHVYGLGGGEPRSVRGLAEEWGVPKSRLDRLLARTLVELRRTLMRATAEPRAESAPIYTDEGWRPSLQSRAA